MIALMLGLVAGTASFAQTATDTTPDVVVTSTREKLQVYVAPQSANATIKLHDQMGHLLYTTTTNVSNGFRQTFDLTNLESGTYKISIVKNGQTTDKTVVIESVPAQKQILLGA